MARYDYDLVVIGAGSGGLATAKRAASYGARTAIVEHDRVGGTCVIRGCIPKKLMVYAAELGHASEDAAGYGWSARNSGFDWERMVRDRDAAIEHLERTHERLLREAGVELLSGRGVVADPHCVQIGERRLSTASILIASGASPVFPEVEGIEYAISSDGFFELEQQPGAVAVVGGGYIAVEFAGMLAALGSRVSIIFRRELPLAGFDEDLRRELYSALEAGGVEVLSSTVVKRIESGNSGCRLSIEGPGGSRELAIDKALVYATGRRPNSGGLGLAENAVDLGPKGEVLCDENGRTSVESILAVGDVTGRAALTPVAIQAGRAIADRVFGGKHTTMSYENIPTAVFSHPPIGTVGLSESAARERFGEDGVKVYKSRFTPLYHTLTERKVPTLVKLVVSSDAAERVLGCHIIGRDAAEIIQGFAVAVKMGATKADFDATVGIHPSTAEEFVTM